MQKLFHCQSGQLIVVLVIFNYVSTSTFKRGVVCQNLTTQFVKPKLCSYATNYFLFKDVLLRLRSYNFMI